MSKHPRICWPVLGATVKRKFWDLTFWETVVLAILFFALTLITYPNLTIIW